MATVYAHRNRWRAQTCVNGRRASRVFPTEALARAWADREEGRTVGMPALRAALADHKVLSMLPLKLRDAVDRANFSESEIVASSFRYDLDSGIYFLIRDDAVVYVGQAKNVLRRILRHREDGRKFQSFAVIPCEMEHLDELEQIYIRLLMPEINQKGI